MNRKRKSNGNLNKILAIMLGLVMSLGSFPMTGVVFAAAGDIPIDEAHFPDYIFRNYVIKKFDKNKDNVLDEGERNLVTNIDGPNPWVITGKIANLRGIEYFPNLRELYCFNQKVTYVDLSKNTNLNKLNLGSNQLGTLDLSKNTRLKELNLSNNQMGTLDLSNNTYLVSLNLSNNQLKTLDLSNNTYLVSLNLSNNQMGTLDLSNNTELTSLNLSNNQMKTLDLSKNTRLNELNLSNNQMGTLDLSNNTRLTSLNLSNNQMGTLDLSNNTELVSLNLSNNQMKTLDLAKEYIHLGDLNLEKNQLKTLDLSKFLVLKKLNLGNNQLKALDLSKNQLISDADLTKNQLKKLILDKKTKLLKLDAAENQLETVDVGMSNNIQSLDLSNNQLGALDLSKNTELTTLDLSNNQLGALDLSKNTELTTLDLSNNQLKTLNLHNLLKLEYISLDGNKLTSLEMLLSDKLNSNSDIFYDYIEYGEPPYAQEYSINVDVDAKKPDELQFDLKSLPEGFDVSKTSNWQGGKVEGTTLKINSDKPSKIKYKYIVAEKRDEYPSHPDGFLRVILNVNYVNIPGISTVTFDGNGGTPEKDTLKTDKNGKLAALPSATYKGCKFDGWYTEKTGGNKIDEGNIFKDDTTLYAHWEVNPALLKLSKYEAKEMVEKAATKRIEEIEAVNGADADDIAKAKQEVNEAKAAGIANIERASMPIDVEKARDEAIKMIGNVALPTDKLTALKADAKKAIEEAAAKRKVEIDAVKNADADEVKNAKAKVEKEKTDGINAVENAKTVKAVNEAKDAAIEAIGKVELPKAGGVTPPAPTGEYTITFNPNGGKAANETAKTDKDGKLKDMPSATYEGYIFEGWYTKKDAGDKVDTNTVFKADTVIYAHWKEDKAYQDELKDLKAASVKEVEKAAAEKTAELEKTPNAKAEEIDKAKAKVEAEKAAGIKKINEGKTKSEVTESKYKAIEAIKAVKVDQGTATPLDDAKDKAKEEIGKKADEAKDKITNDPNLSDEEKDKAKEEIDKEKAAADKKIDEATDESGVDKAKEDGEKAIADKAKEAEDKGNTNLANEKNDAKAKIEEAATKKNEEIDKASATPEAKQEAKDKVAKAKEAADKAVENADTIAKVDEARDKGITEIGKVEVKTTTPTGKEYEVKFISNKIGATKEEVVETRKIKEGEKVGDLPKELTDENRPDYRFSGWYTKKEGGDKLEAETKIEKEMTIYAHWKKRPIAKNYADVSGNKFSIKGTKNLNVNEGVYQDEKLPKNTRPYQLTVTAKPSRRMLVEWTNCKKLGADIDGYIITRKVGRSDTFVHYATVGANRNYFIDTLPKKNTNYYYMVFGYKKDKMGNITISENSMSAVGQRLDSAKINPYAPKLNYTKKTIRQGESVKLRLTYPKNSISTWTRWRTHNDAVKVAKVNQQGVVTGLNKGKVLVSARTPNGRDIRCLITVI